MIPLRILIVDDEPIICDLLEALLTDYGHETVAVYTATDADRCLLFDRFDLVVTDLQLGESSGMEIIRKAKALDDTTIVFMMTGCRDALCRSKALDAGADAFLDKPFDLDELISLIQFHSIKYLAAGKLRAHAPLNDLAVSE